MILAEKLKTKFQYITKLKGFYDNFREVIKSKLFDGLKCVCYLLAADKTLL